MRPLFQWCNRCPSGDSQNAYRSLIRCPGLSKGRRRLMPNGDPPDWRGELSTSSLWIVLFGCRHLQIVLVHHHEQLQTNAAPMPTTIVSKSDITVSKTNTFKPALFSRIL